MEQYLLTVVTVLLQHNPNRFLLQPSNVRHSRQIPTECHPSVLPRFYFHKKICNCGNIQIAVYLDSCCTDHNITPLLYLIRCTALILKSLFPVPTKSRYKMPHLLYMSLYFHPTDHKSPIPHFSSNPEPQMNDRCPPDTELHFRSDIHAQCRIEDKNIQQNLNMARKLAINLIKRYKERTASKQALSKNHV